MNDAVICEGRAARPGNISAWLDDRQARRAGDGRGPKQRLVRARPRRVRAAIRDEIDLLDLLPEPPGTPPIRPMQPMMLAS